VRDKRLDTIRERTIKFVIGVADGNESDEADDYIYANESAYDCLPDFLEHFYSIGHAMAVCFVEDLLHEKFPRRYASPFPHLGPRASRKKPADKARK
jgi:hypothetical protein